MIAFLTPVSPVERCCHTCHFCVNIMSPAKLCLRLARPLTQPALRRSYATEAGGASKTLLLIEHRDGKISPATLSALTASQALGGEVVGLLATDGDSADAVKNAAKKYARLQNTACPPAGSGRGCGP